MKANEIIVNNVKPTQLCFIKKNDNIENTKFDDNNEHLAMLINGKWTYKIIVIII